MHTEDLVPDLLDSEPRVLPNVALRGRLLISVSRLLSDPLLPGPSSHETENPALVGWPPSMALLDSELCRSSCAASLTTSVVPRWEPPWAGHVAPLARAMTRLDTCG